LSSPIELVELHRLVENVRRCAASLSSHFGDIPPLRRIVNDADRLFDDTGRLDVDAGELDLARGAESEQHAGDKIQVPDNQYDADFWGDADDEGIGGQHSAR